MTGASTGIGLSLAFECASHGYDLLIVADEPQIHEAARELQQTKVEVEARSMPSRVARSASSGFMPGTYQAVYNGTKAFLDSFSFALRAELKGSGVTVTCLMWGFIGSG